MKEGFLKYYSTIQRGQKLLELKRPAEALSVFQEALLLSPNFFLAYEGMAFSYRELKQYAKAQNCIKQGLSIAPNQASLFFLQGIILHERGKHDKAVKSLEQAVTLAPDNEDYQVALAIALEGRGGFRDVLFFVWLQERKQDSPPDL